MTAPDAAPSVSVYSDVPCHLGEGPTSHPALGRLVWFDILGKRLLERDWAGGKTTVVDLGFNPSAMAVVNDRRQLIAGHDGLHIRDLATSGISLVQRFTAETTDLRTNDGRVHPCGAFWISRMGRKAEPKAGGIWWYFRGTLRKIISDITIPNAISFSADGTTAYYTDTVEHVVLRVATDPTTGLPTGQPKPFVTFGEGEGGPDGAVVDADGLFWNCRWGVGRLTAHDPQGRLVHSIAVPAKQCTCPAFVGPDADRIVVTSAREGLDDAALAADPLAGQTFLVDFPVRGRFDPPVRMS